MIVFPDIDVNTNIPRTYTDHSKTHVSSSGTSFSGGGGRISFLESPNYTKPDLGYGNFSELKVSKSVPASSSESLLDYDKIYNILSKIQSANSAGAVDEARRNREFQQASADRAMAFEAEQAALDRLFQQSSADKAMEFSRSEAQAQRDYEERMSNTAYQRSMADLKAAGLNPILAYAHPANVPSGVAARSSAASGSRASGRSASGSQAKVDSATEILGMLLSGVGSLIGSAGKLFSALRPSTRTYNFFDTL